MDKPRRRGVSRRKDPTKCGSGQHPWIPENIKMFKNGAGRLGPKCRLCENQHTAEREARERAADPMVAKLGPGRAPQRKGAHVAEDYAELRELGYSFEEIAVRLEMKRGALARCLERRGAPR